MTTSDDTQPAHDEGEHGTAPESISTEHSDVSPAEREREEIEANEFRASLKY